MITSNLLKKIENYERSHEKRNLLAAIFMVTAGISVASIGGTKLFNALAIWLSETTLMGPQFDQMMASSTSALVLILPSLLFFVLAYLLSEAHSLGLKLAAISAFLTLSTGILTINPQLTLAGVLCFLAFEIEFFNRNFRKVTDKQFKSGITDSPIVTENLAKFGLRMSAFIGVLILLAITVYTLIRGAEFLSLDFVFRSGYNLGILVDFIDGAVQAGISDYVIGSILIVLLCEAISFPLGLCAAIYMSEYAPDNRITSTIRFFIETLAGAPSIVIALFGFYFLAQKGIGLGWGVSWLAAAVCLSFMTLPWNIRVAEEAMKSIPYSYREGAYALGATKWQTVRKVVILAAIPGIITGFILGLGAAFGETTVLILTADVGNSNLPAGLPLTGEDPGMPTLPVMIFRTYRAIVAEQYIWDKTNVAFAAGFVLLAIFLVICFAGLYARNHWAKKSGGH
ncbi:MAG: phosphate ABC transporter permease PstA [Candidatus Bathyarchaeota archaeon]|nr:phosphate ABC transporter permease PstA [Candidatus Bathyarchaeota archaeon]